MITETLTGSEDVTLPSRFFSDSALKVVLFTTLYVDVKEPAVRTNGGGQTAATDFGAQKNSILSPDLNRFRFNPGQN